MLDPHEVRQLFPALAQTQDGRAVVFFDNPGGTQVPLSVVDAVTTYLVRDNANHGGAFATSQRSDAMLAEAHQAMADMLGAASPREIVFGANMTTLTFSVSRALARTLSPGDEVVVTHLDHDANIAPWVLAAEDRGAVVRWVDLHPEDCTLDLESLSRQLSPRTKLVAVGLASNAVGTVNDVRKIAALVHQAGALLFVDAVQFAPHAPIDVRHLDCDFLACSAYKFFGPHVGILYGRLDLLESLRAYKVRPAGQCSPDKFETGTQNHEGIAGTLAAVEYLAGLAPHRGSSGRRERLVAAFGAIQEYESHLCRELLAGLASLKGVRVLGITDQARLAWRVPTISFTMEGHAPRAMAEQLGRRGIFTWSGHFYALSLSERLDLEPSGMLRVGLAHYNTMDEVHRLLEELSTLRSR